MFPLLDPDIPIEEIRRRCPVLFWTIIATAARSLPAYAKIFSDLRQIIPSLISGPFFQRDYYSILPCQALLILCVWPLPVEQQKNDVCWIYSGIAMQMATASGLHKVDFAHEYAIVGATKPSAQERRAMVRTWYCTCFVASM